MLRVQWLFGSILILLLCEPAQAFRYHGRLALGVYNSIEEFKNPGVSSEHNDVRNLSGRFYLGLSEVGSSKFDITADVRDKHEFFGKLTKDQLALEERNTFQVRQLSIGDPQVFGRGFYQVGRFAVLDAGSVFNDGIELGWRTGGWKSGLFAGLNAKRHEQSYVQSNAESKQGGLYSTYESKGGGWSRVFRMTHAFVQQMYESDVDRQFLYQNILYQWGLYNRVLTLLYLDMVPRTNVQNALMSLQNRLTTRLENQLDLSGVDVIEYQRNQGVREKLDPSPYQEVKDKITFRQTPRFSWIAQGRYGIRKVDDLKRTEGALGIGLPGYFSKRWDMFVLLGSREEFNSKGVFVNYKVGYFSDKRELTLSVDASTEKYEDGTKLNPVVVELSASQQLSKELFGIISLQGAADEEVTIMGAFVRVGYRFGNREISPLRDGAAPRGQL
ncbi:MAG: hypothetical protein H6624_08205 [Bdellovibrionaceae bacterium]|nr:hypothetical protein [Bdellovibrionales bacterium]MCB9084314.1 hypothetical protein [Pseudobdellovibrionaceae bacterium]